MMRREIMLAVVSVAVTSACASVARLPSPPAGDPSMVEILRIEPRRAHGRLGEIVVDASGEQAPPVAETEQRLRTLGLRLGADAIVVVYDTVQPAALYVSGSWRGHSADGVSGRRLVGVAIRYLP